MLRPRTSALLRRGERLNDGAEDIFLSGTTSGTDILSVPEPAILLPVALPLLPFGASAPRLRKRQLVSRSSQSAFRILAWHSGRSW